MSLNIKEQPNKKLKIINTANNLDKVLADDLPEPLPNYSGFNWVIAGASGSGKTTLMTSIMSQRKKKGKRQSYRKVFDKIYIISPTLGQGKSAKNDPFLDVPAAQKFKEFNLENINEIYETLEANRDDDLHSVLILDDVGAQIRKNAQAEKKLTSLLQNRRHVFTSVFTLVQRFRDLQTGVRANMSHFCTFRPKNVLEEEAICTELMPFHKKNWRQIMDYIFENDDKFSFLMIDMSLKNTNKYLYYNKFNPLDINES